MKKTICKILIFALLFCTIVACGKTEEETEIEDTPVIENTDDNSEETNADYTIIGDVLKLGDSDEMEILDEFETITIEIPDSIPEDQYQNLFGAYFGEDYTYFYTPDPEMLEQGILQYEILHHCDQGMVLATDEVKIKKYVEKAAVLGVTRDITESQLKDSFRDTLNNTLDSLGIDSDDYGGTIFRYIMAQDTKGEILTAALDGDNETLVWKTSSAIANYLIQKTEDGYGVGDVVDLVKACKDGEDPAEATINLCKEIEKKVFPQIDAVCKVADAVDKWFDIWANDAINEIYEKHFKDDSDASGNISDDDWNTIFEMMRGAETRLASKGVDEEALRERFAQRKANETKIAERTKELNKRIDSWTKRDLLYWDHNGFKHDIDIATRLNSLFAAREYLRERYTVNGVLNKGDLTLTTDEFLDTALEWWANTSNRSEFYKWEKEHGLVKVKETSGDYAWQLVNTEVEQHENLDDSYIETFTASATSRTYTIAGKNNYANQKGSFTASCDAPPEVIYADEEFSMNLSLSASGESDYYFLANAWIVIADGKMKTKDDRSDFTVGTFEGADRNFDVTVYGKLEKGGEGATTEIKFCACQSDTTWTYEWKKVSGN